MAITFKDEEKDLYQSSKYTLVAYDEMEEFSNTRTLIFKSEDREIKIGSYETIAVAGEYEWCVYADDYIAVLHQNKQTGLKPTIKILFDTNKQDFVVGNSEYCHNYLKELKIKKVS